MLPEYKNTIVAATPCVTPELVAKHLNRIDLNDDDASLYEMYIAAAEDSVSREIKRPLGVCTVAFGYSGSAWYSMEISFDPVVEVLGVTVNDVAVTDYSVDLKAYIPRVALAKACSADDRIEVRARVGYAPVPQSLRVAVLELVAGMDMARANVSEKPLTANPAFQRLIAAYKQEFVY